MKWLLLISFSVYSSSAAAAAINLCNLSLNDQQVECSRSCYVSETSNPKDFLQSYKKLGYQTDVELVEKSSDYAMHKITIKKDNKHLMSYFFSKAGDNSKVDSLKTCDSWNEGFLEKLQIQMDSLRVRLVLNDF